MKKYLLIIPLAVITLISGCKCSSDQDNEIEDDFFTEEVFNNNNASVDKSEILTNVINLASPVEVAFLIKSTGAEYDESVLASTNNLVNSTNTYNIALNLGILGADLGYLMMYEEKVKILTYISAIKNQADKLKVGHFFDFTLFKKLATNSNNMDSLMFISINSFNAMELYLKDNKRDNISVLVITGLWIESLYIAEQIHTKTKDKDIAERIGEQKIIISDLIKLIEQYDSNPKYANLLLDIKDLQSDFDKVNIYVKEGSIEHTENEDNLVIKQNEETVIEINDETIAQINSKIKKIRNKIII